MVDLFVLADETLLDLLDHTLKLHQSVTQSRTQDWTSVVVFWLALLM